MTRKHHITDRVYNYVEVETTCCVNEWLLNCKDDNVVDRMFGYYGAFGMRACAMQAAIIVNAVLDAYEKHAEYDEAFDWEFVPMVCRQLDWEKLCDNNQYGDGKWRPDIEQMAATLLAIKAMRIAA